jgi:hypothetical protein
MPVKEGMNMTRYIKFEDDKAISAPFKKEFADYTIFGYNAPTNESMLLADGYVKYDGDAPLECLKLVNGEIVEMPIPEPAPIPQTYTKLQIRRALRQAGKEAMLDALLESNEEVKKDWLDAQEIALDDEMLNNALSPELKAELIAILEG